MDNGVKMFVKQNDEVKAGSVLAEVNWTKFKKVAKSIETPLVITVDTIGDVKIIFESKKVNSGDIVLSTEE